MDATTKNLLTGLVLAIGTVAGTYVITKRAILRRCRSKVKSDCSEVPFIGTDEFCTETARDICRA